MTVREYRSEDCAEILELFYETVHSVNSADYTESQLDAWAPREADLRKWDDRLSNSYAVVTEADGVITGFGNLVDTGCFDLLYVHKEYQRIGIATLIADVIERYASGKGLQAIMTDASITARPFFEKRGYRILEKQIVECRGQDLVNFRMRKILPAQND